MSKEISKEYNLTFLEAMVAIYEGKCVKNEHYPWIYFYIPENGGEIEYVGLQGRQLTAVFNEKEQTSKWRLADESEI